MPPLPAPAPGPNPAPYRPIHRADLPYEVAPDGRTRSVRSGRDLIPFVRGGYLTVDLWLDGERTRFAVHHLVAFAFIGGRPEGMEIDHIDGNRFNNHVCNIEWVSHEENVRRYNAQRSNREERSQCTRKPNGKSAKRGGRARKSSRRKPRSR